MPHGPQVHARPTVNLSPAMYVKSLSLRAFRCYPSLHLTPGPGINILVGANAMGKSSVLEAIYLLATTRSLRAGREAEMIRSESASAEVHAVVERERRGEVDLALTLAQGEKKSAFVNAVRRPRMMELLGEMNAVFFGSVDLGVVSGEPALRRRYLNLEISQISPKYCFDLAGYKRVLEQRNRLLRDMREHYVAESGLDAWNEQMVRFGAPIVERRRFFTDRLAPMAAQIHSELTDDTESLELRYVPNIETDFGDTPEEIARKFSQELELRAVEELRRGTSAVGPQRDDLQFLVNGTDARPFGSQGQQRTVSLSLKLAEARLIEEEVGEPPIVLLDDVMSDLDDRRRAHLLEWVRRRCQTFITCTSTRSVPKEVLDDACIWTVENGEVRPA